MEQPVEKEKELFPRLFGQLFPSFGSRPFDDCVRRRADCLLLKPKVVSFGRKRLLTYQGWAGNGRPTSVEWSGFVSKAAPSPST